MCVCVRACMSVCVCVCVRVCVCVCVRFRHREAVSDGAERDAYRTAAGERRVKMKMP